MTAPLVELVEVTKSYAQRGAEPFPALRGLSLQIEAGEEVAILGKSGSGKSTLLNLIAGLDRATAGTLRVAGAELGQLSENALARWRGRHVGVVFQFFQLLPTLTVRENLLLAMDLTASIAKAGRGARADELLEQVGLAEHAAKLPSALSGGQQQRAAIARALANDPPLLLADEPTGNLDSETAAGIDALFRGLVARGKTLLVVTHDQALAERARRVVHLRDGRLHSDTSHPAMAVGA